ncbi:MAG: flavin reductase family protein [Candidatus Lokiarchaeota archaeon]|nr:flavin reductase family protein [Candidatus Lokiarchaeota archaeon]
MPVALIGANVNGNPNFETLAYVGIIEAQPPLISIASYETHYTNIGIKENGTFSVNTPSEVLAEKIDYVGIVSGKETDKSEVFDIFYGDLKTAPMASLSPLNLECEVVKTFMIKELVDVDEGHEIFIGKVVNAYADEKYLTDGIPDITKFKTYTYSLNNYWKVGEKLAPAFEIGKKYEKQ